MKYVRSFLVLFILCSIPGVESAMAQGTPSGPAQTETDPRLNPNGQGWRLQRATIVDAKLPRVLLIGDSVLNGYLPYVQQALAGKANVDAWVNPCWQSDQTNKTLADVLSNGPYDVIHFNLGLHGWAKGRIPEGQYVPLTKAYVTVLKQKCPNARLIWATITPVTVKKKPTELDPVINPTIIDDNRMALQVMKEEGVQVNDFYGLLIDKLVLAKGDQFHWTAPAYKILGDASSVAILNDLPGKSSP